MFILIGVMLGLGLGVAGLFLVKEWRYQSWLASERVEGLRLAEEGDVVGALEHLARLVRLTPEDGEVLRVFAESREAVPTEDGSHIRAAIVARRLLAERDPADLEAQRALMRLYAMAGYATEADQLAEAILRLDPKDSEALVIRISVARSRGRTAEAQNLALRLTETGSGGLQALRTRLGVAAGDTMTLAEATAQLRTWALPPALEPARLTLLAELLARQGLREQALASARDAAALNPTDLETLASLAEAFDTAGGGNEGTALLEAAIGRSPEEVDVVDHAIRRHWWANRLDKARAELAQAGLALGRDEAALLRWEMFLAVPGERDPNALAAVTRLGELNAEAPPAARAAEDALLAAMRQLIIDPSDPTFDSLLEKAIELNQRNPILRAVRAERLLAAGRPDRAVEDLIVAHQVEGRRWARAGLLLAVTTEALGARGAALTTCSEVLARYGDQLPVILTFASLWANYDADGRRLEDVQLASIPNQPLLEFLQSILEQSDDDPRVATLLAEAAARRNDVERRERALAILERPRPISPVFLKRLAQVAVDSGSPRREVALRLVEAANPVDPDLLRLQALDLARQGNAEEGLALLEAAASDPARGISSSNRLGLLAGFARRHGLDAAEALEQAWYESIRDDPPGPLVLLSFEATWRDETTARKAVDRAAAALGANHPEVLKAEARWTLAFRRDEEVRRGPLAESLRAQFEAGSEDPQVALYLAQLEALAAKPDSVLIEQALRRRLQVIPLDLAPYSELASVLLERGNTLAAAEVAAQLLERAEAPAARRQAALILAAANEPAQAAVALQKLVADYDLEVDRLALARCLILTGGADSAAEADRIVLDAASRSDASTDAILAATERLVLLDRAEDAIALIEARQAESGDLDLPVVTLRTWLLAERAEEARVAADALRSLGRTDPAAIVSLADWSASAGDLDAAVAMVRSALLESLDEPVLLAWAAQRPAHPGWRFNDSPELLTRLQSGAPGLMAVAELQRSATRPDGSIVVDEALLERSLSLVEQFPRLPMAWRTALVFHARLGRIDQAIALARRATTALPLSSLLQEGLAVLLLDAGRPREALTVIEVLAGLDGIDPQVVSTLKAKAELLAGLPAEALRTLAALDGSSLPPEAPAIRAAALLELGRTDESLAALGGDRFSFASILLPRLIRLTPDGMAAALAEIRPVLAEDPSLAIPLTASLTEAWVRLEDPKVLDLAAEIANSLPETPSSLISAGDLLAAQGRLDESIDRYRAALDSVSVADRQRLVTWATLPAEERASLAATQMIAATALNNMAYRLAENDRVTDEALAWIEEAMRIMPDTPALRDTFALVLYRLGRLSEARVEAEAAVLGMPNDPAVRYNLAEILRKSRAYADARAQASAAIELIDSIPGSRPTLRGKLDRLIKSLPADSPTGTSSGRDLPGYLRGNP